MKSPLAKARDKWLESDDGKECCKGNTSGQYLQNRLKKAFLAGAEFSTERIEELELAKTIGIQACDLLKERTKELEAEIGEYAGLKVHNQQVERIKELKDYLVEFGDHKCGCLAIATNNKEHCTCGFEQALKGK